MEYNRKDENMPFELRYFIDDRFTSFPGDIVPQRKLSLAVWPEDVFTQERPIGMITAGLKEEKHVPIVNLSGYHCFVNVPDGNYILTIESTYYNSVERTISLPYPDPKKPVETILLDPKPGYPFPQGATLVRGIVSITEPVADALVRVIEKDIETKTDAKGIFVLFFKKLKERKENIIIEIRKDSNTKVIPVTIEEGKSLSMGIISFSQ
jgi:hypothetical protein